MRFNSDFIRLAAKPAAYIGVGFVAGYLACVVVSKYRYEEEVIETDQLEFNFEEDDLEFKVRKMITNQTEEIKEVFTSVIVEAKDVPEVDLSSVIIPEPTKSNIFDSDLPEWDESYELTHRSTDYPYVISYEEFSLNENDFSKTSLTYYSGDQVLCDEDEVPLYNAPHIVGDLRFGHGSKDPSIVYICNSQLQSFYEVILDEGYFQREVLGAEIEDHMNDEEIKHSHTPRKFKKD